MKYIILLIIVIAVLYVHYRGRVRYRFWRQLSDHSIYRAAEWIYVFIFPRAEYALSAAGMFPRAGDIAAKLAGYSRRRSPPSAAGADKAADKYNDAGLTHFQNRLETLLSEMVWDAHPSASQLCPQTTALLRDIPSVKAAMFATLPDGSRLPRHRDLRRLATLSSGPGNAER